MSININSETDCMRAYLNYHCYDNWRGITDDEMGQIVAKYSDRIPTWQATMGIDENKYEFDDSEFENWKAEGRKNAEDRTGYSKGDKAGNIIEGTVAAGVSGAGAVNAAVGTVKDVAGMVTKKAVEEVAKETAEAAAKAAVKKVAEDATQRATEKFMAMHGEDLVQGALPDSLKPQLEDYVAKEVAKATEEETAKQAKNAIKAQNKQNVGKYIQAGIAIATAAAYLVRKPNQKEAEACNELNQQMFEEQDKLQGAQDEMDYMQGEIIDLSDEAVQLQEETATVIHEEQGEIELFAESRAALKAKAESGVQLSESEKALYVELAADIADNSGNIDDVATESVTTNKAIVGDLESFQSGYDFAAETMANTEGVTDYAESIDKAAKTMCTVEGISQTANAFTGATAGAKLLLGSLPMNFLAKAMGAASIAAGLASGKFALDQFKRAKEIQVEIDNRTATQDFNLETNDVYTEELDMFEANVDTVKALEAPTPVETDEGLLDETLPENNNLFVQANKPENQDPLTPTQDDEKKKKIEEDKPTR